MGSVNQVLWIGCKKLVNHKLRLTNQLWLPIMENSWDWWVVIAGINYRVLFSYHGDQPWHTSQNFLAVILCFYNFISCTTWVLLFSAENSIFSWVNYWLCNIYSNLQNWKNSLIQLISYKQNGILHMLDRNRRIKAHPERFQETEEEFDLVVTVEERVYDQVIECEYPFTC